MKSKNLLTVVVFSIFFCPLSGSVIHHKYVEYSNVIIRLSYNYNSSWNTLLPYYKGVGYFLNERIDYLIKSGRIDKKRFEIKIGFPYELRDVSIDISKGKESYYIQLYDSPDLIYLLHIIEYFASESWQPLKYPANKSDFSPRKDYIQNSKAFMHQRLSDIPVPELTAHQTTKELVVGHILGLQYRYINEKLKYSLNGQDLSVEPNQYPAQYIQGYYFIIGEKSLFIYSKTELIRKIEIPKINSGLPHDYKYKYLDGKVVLKHLIDGILEFDLISHTITKL